MAECKAVLRVADRQYGCDIESPHAGYAHANAEAQAHWVSEGEARRYRPDRNG